MTPRSDVTARLDLALAGAFTVVIVGGTVAAARAQDEPLHAWAVVLVVVAGLTTVGLRRTAPIWGLAAAMVAVSTYLIAGYPYGPIQLCMVIAMFEVGRRLEPRVSGPACAVASLVASMAILPRLTGEVRAPLLLALGWTAWIVLPWSLGALFYVTTKARERARRDLMQRAGVEERSRLAGEVHDVAGHGFAVVAMHAGVALLVLDERPDQVRASLEAIKATSGRSLAELRGMLDAFHPRQNETGLAALSGLVDDVRAGGLPVELSTEELTLAEEVDAVVYRVAREALTNVVRHAGSTTASVRINRDGDDVVVEVLDRGAAKAKAQPEAGRGLTTMRSRVEAVGGVFEAGPRECGGFRVLARMPMAGGSR